MSETYPQDRTQSEACADGQHHACLPWNEDCNCKCHEGGVHD